MSEQIERIQKICVNIILCDTDWDIPYNVECTLLEIEPLKYRHTELCIKFIQKHRVTPDMQTSSHFIQQMLRLDKRSHFTVNSTARRGDFLTARYAI